MNMPLKAATPAALPPVTVNTEQNLFVIRQAGGGFTCYGFKNCRESCEQLSAVLQRPDLNDPSLMGTLQDYENYQALVALYARSPLSKDIYFEPGTAPEVKKALQTAMEQRYTVRLHLGNTTTGKSWNEEWDVIGKIGQSMGPMRVPLLVSKGESGGSAILTSCILRIQRIKSGSLYDANNSVDLYVHPMYASPNFFWKRETRQEKLAKGYVACVYNSEDVLMANFKTEEAVFQYIAFMRGEAQTTKPRKPAFA